MLFVHLPKFQLKYDEISRGKAYIIDVSQSVEHDHPHALEFLRKDLLNVTEFFKKKGVNVLGVKELFDFVVDPTIEADRAEAVLEELDASAKLRVEQQKQQGEEEVDAAENELRQQKLVEEEVFKKIYIPRTLDEV